MCRTFTCAAAKHTVDTLILPHGQRGPQAPSWGIWGQASDQGIHAEFEQMCSALGKIQRFPLPCAASQRRLSPQRYLVNTFQLVSKPIKREIKTSKQALSDHGGGVQSRRQADSAAGPPARSIAGASLSRECGARRAHNWTHRLSSQPSLPPPPSSQQTATASPQLINPSLIPNTFLSRMDHIRLYPLAPDAPTECL